MAHLQVSNDLVQEARTQSYSDLLGEMVQRAAEWEASAKAAAQRIDELEEIAKKRQEGISVPAVKKVAEGFDVGEMTVHKYVQAYLQAVENV